MKKSLSFKMFSGLIIAFAISIIPSTVYAHEGGNLPLGGFLSGLLHPVLGYDHLLAMLSVGILSAQIGGRAIWTVPATFVIVMGFGGMLGLLDIGITITELGIAFSLVILGSIIASERRLPIVLAMIGVGFFAIFHGYAHGTEMPQTAQPATYASGFLTGTALIHITGVLIGDISKRYQRGPQVLRIGGGLIAIVGLMFIFGII
jgi:urease accessory protein